MICISIFNRRSHLVETLDPVRHLQEAHFKAKAANPIYTKACFGGDPSSTGVPLQHVRQTDHTKTKEQRRHASYLRAHTAHAAGQRFLSSPAVLATRTATPRGATSRANPTTIRASTSRRKSLCKGCWRQQWRDDRSDDLSNPASVLGISRPMLHLAI